MTQNATQEVSVKKYCQHASEEIKLYLKYTFPADILPDSPPQNKKQNLFPLFRLQSPRQNILQLFDTLK